MHKSAFYCGDEKLAAIVQQVAMTDDEQSLQTLDDAVRQWPDDPRLRFLRGSVLAQMRQYDQAISEMERAVELNPTYGIARFQLGLLHFTSGRVGEALAVWDRLSERPSDDALRLFKEGLELLAQDRAEESIARLQLGIAANKEFPPLSRDMEMLIKKLQEAAGASPAAETGASTHVLLSGYETNALKH